MNYNDFPILNNEEYELINQQFLSLDTFDRKTQMSKICQELNFCINSCFTISSQYNHKIRQALFSTNQTLTKLFDNFSSLFNINLKVTTVSSLSIFTFLNKLTNLITLLQDWMKNEEKEYYISTAHKSIKDICDCITNILSSLNESNLHFFKHM